MATSPSPTVTFRVIRHRSAEYFRALELRHALMRAPLGLSYSESDIAAEASSLHIIGERFGEIIATLQLVEVMAAETLKMRQVAVAELVQRQGIGVALVRYAENLARENGGRSIVLHARENVVPFYESLGYGVMGDTFEEVGIPHRKMGRKL